MNKTNRVGLYPATGLGLLLLTLTGCMPAPMEPAPAPLTLPAPGPEQIFMTPEQASQALAEANRHDDKSALLKILGPSGAKIISSGDKVADRESRNAFVAAYDTTHTLEDSMKGQKTLVVGREAWPLPIPLVHVADTNNPAGGWQFDTEAGQQEILNRRIGANEMDAIQFCRVYVIAQREFAAQHKLSDGHVEYAQRFISHKGTHDGLYWHVEGSDQESPLGPMVADARAEGYGGDRKNTHHHPYHGYYYKILTAQGESAAGGAQSYIKDGHMTGGFALVAFPAQYGDSGIMTFMVDQNGIVFQKNLGTETTKIAREIHSYNPDNSWDIAILQP